MKLKKLTALLLSGLLALSLVACAVDEPEVTPEPVVEDVTPTPAPPDPVDDPDPVPVAVEASIDFEDGNFDFVQMYTAPVNAAEALLQLASYEGSSALQVINLSGQVPYVAIDVSSILGPDVVNVASVEMSLGTTYVGGGFSAASGRIIAWVGEKLEEVVDTFSIYVPNQNPKVVTASAFAGQFVAGANNIFIIQLNEDLGPSEGNGDATLYIDDIRFLDAAGNLIKGDTAVAFNAPAGFEAGAELDPNLYYLADAVEVAGLAGARDAAWSQGYVGLSAEEKALLVPGSMIEVVYKSDLPVWVGYNGEAGWIRAIDDSTYDYSVAYVSADNSVVQWPYEQLLERWGEGFEEGISELFVEAANDWEVLSVRIGQAQNLSPLGNAVEITGFSGVSDGGWAQAYVPLSDEEKELLVPGSVIEVVYNSEEPVWVGYNGENGWMRGFPGQDIDYGVGARGEGIVQWPYEMLTEEWGDGWVETIGELFVEAWNDWEVLSVRIGKPFEKSKGVMHEITGFAGTSGGGWAQAYVGLSDAEKALLTPGSFINVYYASEEPVWLGYNGEAGWMRAFVDGEIDYSVFTYTDTIVQTSFEQLTESWGDGWVDTIAELFVEAWNDWEVMAVYIGRN